MDDRRVLNIDKNIIKCSVTSLSHVWLFVNPEWLHTRLPYISPTRRVYSNSCPSTQWCHPTISSSVIPFSCLQSFQHQDLIKWVSSSHQVAKVLEFQLQYQSFQWLFRTEFLADGLVESLCSPRDSPESSPTPQFKVINPSVLSFVYSPTLTSMTTGKIIS